MKMGINNVKLKKNLTVKKSVIKNMSKKRE